jgi:hypothetical protein
MAEFGSVDVGAEKAAERYLGLDAKAAKARASRGELPFPVYRCGSQKSPWMVRITDLAEWIDKEREKGINDWRARNGIA